VKDGENSTKGKGEST